MASSFSLSATTSLSLPSVPSLCLLARFSGLYYGEPENFFSPPLVLAAVGPIHPSHIGVLCEETVLSDEVRAYLRFSQSSSQWIELCSSRLAPERGNGIFLLPSRREEKERGTLKDGEGPG